MVLERDVLTLRITGEVSESEMQVLDKGEELYARHGCILFLPLSTHKAHPYCAYLLRQTRM